MNRITWDNYFMKIAEDVSKRSIDPDSKFGCIAVSDSNSILSTGYNGPPRYVNDDKIPLTRPKKYIYIEHAERNCIYNAARNGVSLMDSTFYVTGVCCVDCLRGIYQVGAIRVVMRPIEPSSTKQSWFDFIDFIGQYMKIEYFMEEEDIK